MAKIKYILMLMTFLLGGSNLFSQTINMQDNKIYLKEVRCIDSELSKELVNIVNMHIKDIVKCKYLKYLVIEISNHVPDTVLSIKQFDYNFLLVNQILDNSEKDRDGLESQENDYYFLSIDDLVFISRKSIFKFIFKESNVNFNSTIDSFEIRKKFFCRKKLGIQKTMVKFRLKFKIDKDKNAIRVLDTYFY